MRGENTTSMMKSIGDSKGNLRPNAPFAKTTPREGFKANQDTSKPRNRDTKCFRCLGFGHITSQRPNQRVMLMMPNGEVLMDEEDEREELLSLAEEEEEIV